MFSRRLSQAIMVGLFASIVAYTLSLTPLFHRIENQYGLGILYSLRGPVEPSDGAVVVAIDRATIAWLRTQANGSDGEDTKPLSCLPAGLGSQFTNIRGPSSIPRSVHGCLVESLNKAGFPVIVFDILFSVTGPEDDDRSFANAIRDHGGTVILTGIERSTVRDQASELLVEREVRPAHSIAEFAAASGTFIVPRSVGPVYGYWRRISGFDEIPPLPDEAYRIYLSALGKDGTGLGDTSKFRYLWLYGAPGSIPTISASSILNGQLPDVIASEADKTVVFVGASDPTMTNYPDSFSSFFRAPSSAGISGVELAATAFLNLNSGETLRPLSSAGAALIAIVFVFVLGFAARAWTRHALVIVPLAVLAYIAAASFAFSHMRILLPVSGPVFIAAPLVLMLAVFFKYTVARALLMRLAPAPVARRMLKKETDYRSSAVADEVTVMFFDLIGSTGIAEKLSPIEFSGLLNGYHDTVANATEKHRGQIVSFSGDGVMAVFTRLDAGPDHASRGCRAACMMQSRTSERSIWKIRKLGSHRCRCASA